MWNRFRFTFYQMHPESIKSITPLIIHEQISDTHKMSQNDLTLNLPQFFQREKLK